VPRPKPRVAEVVEIVRDMRNSRGGRGTVEHDRREQIATRALAHCHDDQPECAALLEKR
jgi:hypothetical protein